MTNECISGYLSSVYGIPKPMDEFINELLDDVIKNIR
jgi:hypothetical protein